MASRSSINRVKRRIISESQAITNLEESLSIRVVGRGRNPLSKMNTSFKGTSGFRAKKYTVGMKVQE